jgi:DNA uptake protein ComE-like DNA-binding protein
MKKLHALIAAALASAGIALALAPVSYAADAPKTDAKKAEPQKADAKKAELMDINSASEKDLMTLKGIGDARAKAIVKGRPYKGKNELVDKKIIPEAVYNDIKDQIIAKQK